MNVVKENDFAILSDYYFNNMYVEFDFYMKSHNFTMETEIENVNTTLLSGLIWTRGNFEWLIDTYNPNINFRNRKGETYLFDCSSKNRLVKFIDKGIDVNAKNIHGRSAIFYYGHISVERLCISIMLEAGASFQEALDGNLLKNPETQKLIQSYIESSTNCKSTLIVFLGISKQHHFIHKDLVKVIAKMVWKTRRQKRVWLLPE